MRKLLIVGTGLLVAAAVVATTVFAQSPGTSNTVITVHAQVSPKKVGTPKHPQGVHLNVQVTWVTSGDGAKPVIQSAVSFFPQGSLYNGAKYPSCSATTMDLRGLSACPPGSIMGHGTGQALADTTPTTPVVTVVNGGASHVYFWTVLNNPARVQSAVPGDITYLGKHGKYAYKLILTVPAVLQVVAGVPIALQSFQVSSGKGTWLADTGCPSNHRWPFQVTTFYGIPDPSGDGNLNPGGNSSYQSFISCTPNK